MQPDNYIGFRLPTPLVVQIEALAQAQGISKSEWVRAACIAVLVGTVDPSHAYAAARAMLPAMLKAVLGEAMALVPESYEDAVLRYGVPPANLNDPYG